MDVQFVEYDDLCECGIRSHIAREVTCGDTGGDAVAGDAGGGVGGRKGKGSRSSGGQERRKGGLSHHQGNHGRFEDAVCILRRNILCRICSCLRLQQTATECQHINSNDNNTTTTVRLVARSFVRSFVIPCFRSFVRPYVCSFVRPFIHLFVRPCFRSLSPSFVCFFVSSLEFSSPEFVS